jgi:hypothetical protein
MLPGMSPDLGRGSVRSAADLNQRIRTLFHAAGGYLRPHERLEYEQLVTAWAIADAAERRPRPSYAEAA